MPLFPKQGTDPIVQRPVTDVDQSAVIYLRDRYPSAYADHAADRYAQRAIGAYESVHQLKERDDLRAITGVDTFA
ncbi:hypothetical protein CKO23_07835 [Thiocystis violacea]|nr:hypothetical protein [Thiocystis violacea]